MSTLTFLMEESTSEALFQEGLLRETDVYIQVLQLNVKSTNAKALCTFSNWFNNSVGFVSVYSHLKLPQCGHLLISQDDELWVAPSYRSAYLLQTHCNFSTFWDSPEHEHRITGLQDYCLSIHHLNLKGPMCFLIGTNTFIYSLTYSSSGPRKTITRQIVPIMTSTLHCNETGNRKTGINTT